MIKFLVPSLFLFKFNGNVYFFRFAKFMEGDSHLSDSETFEHDAELTRLIEECEYTDDDNDDEY